jgi:hypothetical protein
LRQPELLQHSHLIPLLPAFNNPSIYDAIENQPANLDTTSSNGQTFARSVNTTLSDPQGDLLQLEHALQVVRSGDEEVGFVDPEDGLLMATPYQMVDLADPASEAAA